MVRTRTMNNEDRPIATNDINDTTTTNQTTNQEPEPTMPPMDGLSISGEQDTDMEDSNIDMESSNQGSDPNNDMESSNQGTNNNNISVIQMVQPIKAPTLASLSRLALTEFQMTYERYVMSTKANGVKGRTKLECVEPRLLNVISKQYLDKNIKDVTNDELEGFIRDRLTKDIHLTEEGMRRIFANVKMDLREPDPVQRVTSYNIKHLTIMMENGLEQFEKQSGFRKQLVGLLLEGVRPASLRQLMRQKTKTSEARDDPKAFFDLLETWAPMQELFHAEDTKTVRYLRERNKRQHPAKRDYQSKRFKKKEPHSYKGSNGKNKRKWSCLICGKESHNTKQHRGASKEDIDKAFREYREKKAAVSDNDVIINILDDLENGQDESTSLSTPRDVSEASNSCSSLDLTNKEKNTCTLHVKALNIESSNMSRELPKVKINGSLEVPCLLDSGTDHPVICRDIVDRLAAESYRLTSPLRCELPMETSELTNVICTERTTLDLQLTLPELPGKSLVCPRVDFIIIESHMPVGVLLGKSFLREIGVDIDGAVKKIVEEVECSNESENVEVHDFQTDREVQEAIKAMLHRALEAGLPNEYMDELQNIVGKYDIWRTKLGPDPPAQVPPMKLKLKPGAPIIQAANRRYPPMYREFMHKRLEELEAFGLVYRNNTSRFSSAVHVVPKVDKPTNVDKHLRWTVDLREINKWIEPITWPMPNLDVVSESVSNAKFFSSFDFMKGYWQTPLHKDSQEILSMVTDRAVYTPTRVIMGTVDAVMYFQSTMQECFKDRLYKSLLLWIDDLLSYAESPTGLLDNMEYIFRVCDKFRLKLNPDKCELFAKTIKFCGKIFSANGIEQDPERIKSLVELNPPTNAGELQQYLCAMNWMRNHIPDFARLCKPLRKILERASKGTSRKSKILRRIPVTFNAEELDQFKRLNDSVAKAVMLAHPSPEADFFLFTDASNDGWGSVLFQIKDYDAKKSIEEQNPEPLYFLSGSFTDAKHRWSIPEKEAYAIVESVERLDFMLIRAKPFYIMTDHRNLTFMFASNTHLKLATRHKISRWALALTCFNYEIMHIDGEKNVWADLLSRWGSVPAETIRIKALALHPFDEDNDFQFPTLDDIWTSQRTTGTNINEREDLETRLTGSERHLYHQGKPWIPEDNEELWNRLLVVAHCGIGGHRGVASTTRVLQKYCSGQGLRTRVLQFLKNCLLCLQTKGGKTIPRPLGRTLQAEAPNQVLHFDFYYVGEATNDWKYVLVLKDGLSHFVDLVGCTTTSAEVVVEALLGWFKRFGIVPTWVSDQPTHFRNKVVSSMAKKLKSSHHFVTAYCPWANGSVERVMRELGTLFRSILGEFKVPIEHWPQVLPIIQYVLNQTPTDSLHGYAPIQIFMGMEPSPPLREIFDPSTEKFTTVDITKESLDKHYSELRRTLETMHKDVKVRSDQIHQRNRRQNANKNGEQRSSLPNFDIGDFVLWSRVDSQQSLSKLHFIWRGPFRIVDTTSDYIFVIEDLITAKQHTVDASRLKFYHDKSLNVSTELLEHVSHQGFLYTVNKLLDMNWNVETKQWEFLVSWKGFEDDENTWEPFTALLKDIPETLGCFLMDIKDVVMRKRLIRKHRKDLKRAKICLDLLE